jgi:hypothetical protein
MEHGLCGWREQWNADDTDYADLVRILCGSNGASPIVGNPLSTLHFYPPAKIRMKPVKSVLSAFHCARSIVQIFRVLKKRRG